MKKQEKIDKIYEVMADKTLSNGCMVKRIGDCKIELCPGDSCCEYHDEIWRVIEEGFYPGEKPYHEPEILGPDGSEREMEFKDFENHMKADNWNVIGHPVMIGDVLDWQQGGTLHPSSIEYHRKKKEVQEKIVFKWKFFRKPIEDQTEEAIDFVFNLMD